MEIGNGLLLLSLVTTEPEATNCFTINFQVFITNGQHNSIKIHLNLLLYKKAESCNHLRDNES